MPDTSHATKQQDYPSRASGSVGCVLLVAGKSKSFTGREYLILANLLAVFALSLHDHRGRQRHMPLL